MILRRISTRSSSVTIFRHSACFSLISYAPVVVSSRASSLASADRRAPRQPSRPISSEVSAFSCNQVRIGQPLASGRADKAFQSRECVMLHVAFIQPEGELVNITAQMFFASMMVDADQPALENRENAFNAVCCHVIACKLAFTMIDGFVIEKHAADARIGAGFVGMQGRADFHMPMNFGLDGP